MRLEDPFGALESVSIHWIRSLGQKLKHGAEPRSRWLHRDVAPRRLLRLLRLFFAPVFLGWLFGSLQLQEENSEGYYSLRGQSHDCCLRVRRIESAGCFGEALAFAVSALLLFFQEFLNNDRKDGSELQGHHAEQTHAQRHRNEVFEPLQEPGTILDPTEGLGCQGHAFLTGWMGLQATALFGDADGRWRIAVGHGWKF